jgi:hypothetical protein
VGHGGKLAASGDVAAEARSTQVASQAKEIHATVLKLRRQADHIGPRCQHFSGHQAAFRSALKSND